MTKRLEEINRKVFLNVCCFMLLIIANIGCKEHALPNNSKIADEIILKVNDTPITQKEYELFRDNNRAMVYNHFHLKYKVEKHTEFWKTDFEGITPEAYLNKVSIKSLIEAKIIQQLAVEKKIITPFKFDEFISNWKKGSISKKKRLSRGEIIYGPTNFSLKNYYHYVLSNLEIKLKAELFKNDFNVDQKNLKIFYDKIKNKEFIYIKDAALEGFCLDYSTSAQKNRNIAIAEKIKLQLNKGTSFNELISKYPDASYTKKSFNDSIKLYGEENFDRDIEQFAYSLKYGTASILDTGKSINSCICVFKLIKPLDLEILPFKDVQEKLLFLYKEEKYQEKIQQLRDHARVLYL